MTIAHVIDLEGWLLDFQGGFPEAPSGEAERAAWQQSFDDALVECQALVENSAPTVAQRLVQAAVPPALTGRVRVSIDRAAVPPHGGALHVDLSGRAAEDAQWLREAAAALAEAVNASVQGMVVDFAQARTVSLDKPLEDVSQRRRVVDFTRRLF